MEVAVISEGPSDNAVEVEANFDELGVRMIKSEVPGTLCMSGHSP